MPLRYMGYLMGYYTSEFVFTATSFNEPRVNANEATGERKSIDVRVIDDEKAEILLAIVGLSSYAVPDFINVFGDLRVFDNLAAASNVSHDRAPDLRFDVLRENCVRRAAHIRQSNVIGPGTAGKDNGYRGKQQHGAFDEQFDQRQVLIQQGLSSPTPFASFCST
jgi:hypothetical protein